MAVVQGPALSRKGPNWPPKMFKRTSQNYPLSLRPSVRLPESCLRPRSPGTADSPRPQEAGGAAGGSAPIPFHLG